VAASTAVGGSMVVPASMAGLTAIVATVTAWRSALEARLIGAGHIGVGLTTHPPIIHRRRPIFITRRRALPPRAMPPKVIPPPATPPRGTRRVMRLLRSVGRRPRQARISDTRHLVGAAGGVDLQRGGFEPLPPAGQEAAVTNEVLARPSRVGRGVVRVPVVTSGRHLVAATRRLPAPNQPTSIRRR
jgi:hypothetical protein